MYELLLEEIKKVISPLWIREGVELVDLVLRKEGRRLALRFFVDKPGGITLDECAELNRAISQILDGEDSIQESYVLEVSSPGLDRPLKSTRDFQRVQGKLVKFVLHEPQERENVWIGFVDGLDDENVIIHTEKGQSLHIARENIARARLELEI